MEIDQERLIELWRDRLTHEQMAVKLKISVPKVKRKLKALYLID